MIYQTLQVANAEGLLILRQNRPDKLNARNSQMYVEIMAVLQQAMDDNSVIGVVLTGNGRFFSAGMDLNNDPSMAYTLLESDNAAVRRVKERLPERDEADVSTWLPVKFIEAFIHFDKLLVGAPNGPAIGEGFTSLLHCDLVYAHEDVYFWAPFARAGVAPEFCSTLLMPRKLGPGLAHAVMYLSERVSAARAYSVGFVQEILEGGPNYEAQVLARLQTAFDLAGPRELRMQTLKDYKALVVDAPARQVLIDQCHKEFELIRHRARSGQTRAVQAHYQSLRAT